MLFGRVKRTDMEKVYVIGKATTTLVINQAVSWDATSITNNYITTPAAGTLGLIAGVLTKSLATDDYGLVQAYGYYPTALCAIHTSGSTDAAQGVPLFAVASAPSLDWTAAGTLDTGLTKKMATVLDAVTFVTDITNEQHKIFIRCL